MQNVRQIAQNADHTMQSDVRTMQNVGRATCIVGHNTLNFCQGPKGGLDNYHLFFYYFFNPSLMKANQSYSSQPN